MPVKPVSSPARAFTYRPFGSRLLALLDRRRHPDLDERQLGRGVDVAGELATGAVRADDGHERHDAGIGQQLGDVGDAPDVLGSIGGREAEVDVQPVADVVAVEQVGGTARRDQRRLDGRGDGRLARTREAGEPDGGAPAGPGGTAHRSVLPDDVALVHGRSGLTERRGSSPRRRSSWCPRRSG